MRFIQMIAFWALFQLTTTTIVAQDTSLQKTNKQKAKVQYGIASFYSNKFNGRKTANGEIFSQQKLTAAHNTLPLGTWVRVTNLRNKKTVIVKINDRLNAKNKRLIDLTKLAAQKLGFVKSGLTRVKVEILGKKGG
jgi:rare lipoprotein A